jgi:hypothetical protein
VFLCFAVCGGGLWRVAVGGWVCYNGGMAGCEDVITYNLSELDPSLLKVLSDWSGGRDVRNSHNAIELAKLYVLWYIQKANRLPTSLKFEVPSPPEDPQTVEDWHAYFQKPKKKSVLIHLPKGRPFRKRYYSWVRDIDLPRDVNWVLITLTLSRDVSKQDAWANINRWVSNFLHRFRNYVKQKGGYLHYIVAIERHKDGYPHAHILAAFPFVPVSKIYDWWRDNKRHLSAFQGVDVEFLGRNVDKVKAYVVKYLVKDFPNLWAFHVDKELNVKVRVSTLFIWYFRVRLLMMSKSIARLRVRPVRSPPNNTFAVFVGYASPHLVWTYYYKPRGIPKSQFWLCFLDAITLEKDWVFWDSILTVRYAKIV